MDGRQDRTYREARSSIGRRIMRIKRPLRISRSEGADRSLVRRKVRADAVREATNEKPEGSRIAAAVQRKLSKNRAQNEGKHVEVRATERSHDDGQIKSRYRQGGTKEIR